MKKSVFYLVLALVFIASQVSLQAAYEFKVNTVKGTVKVNNNGNWKTCKKGDQLNKSDQLKLEKGSYINLIHSNGNPIEVSKSGKYSIAKLAAKAGTKKSEVTKKFTKFIMDELSESDDLLSSNDFNENMSSLGAVERAALSPKQINAKFPRSSYTVNNEVEFSWYASEGTTNYTFFIKSPDDEIIFTKEVSSTMINVDLAKAGVKQGECYFWGIKSGDKSSEEFCIYRMDDNEASEFTSSKEMLMNEIDVNSSIGQLTLASFYKDQKLVSEAKTAFEKAIELAPDVDNFKAIYAKYLIDMGLNDEAAKIIKK